MVYSNNGQHHDMVHIGNVCAPVDSYQLSICNREFTISISVLLQLALLAKNCMPFRDLSLSADIINSAFDSVTFYQMRKLCTPSASNKNMSSLWNFKPPHETPRS